MDTAPGLARLRAHRFLPVWHRLLLLAACLLLPSCASLVSGLSTRLANDLSAAVLNSEDTETVRQGAPAYLILIDSLLGEASKNTELLRIAANLNGAFAAAFVTEPSRARLMSDKAFDYALRAWCLELPGSCDIRSMPFEEFEVLVAGLDVKEVPAAYAVATAWVGWIQAHSNDWNAIAQLSRARGLMERLIELDEYYDLGGPHLYMGGLDSLFPAAMGGRPEKSRMHFERALEISAGRNLTAKVFYAELYARLVFNQKLHDRLLQEVLAADPKSEGVTLINRIAQMRARRLLETGRDYF